MAQDDNGGERPQGGIRLTAGFGDGTEAPRGGLHDLPGQRLLVIGAFGGRGGTQRHALDPQELAGLPGRLGVSIDVAVPNRLGDSPPVLGDRLYFETLRDMAPRRIPELFAPLADAARVIDGTVPDDGRFSRLAAIGEFPSRTEPQASAPDPLADAGGPTGGDDASLDRLLGMVDAGPDAAPDPSAAQRAVSAFISGMGKRGGSGEAATDRSGAAALVAEQRKALLADEGLRGLIETWHGLRLLAQAIGRDSGVRVELVDVGGRPVAEVLAEIASADDAGAQPPPALIVVAGRLRASAPDLETARNIARAAHEMQAPAVVSLAGDFAPGVDLATASAREEPGLLFDGAGFEVWNAMRDEEAGRWLCAVWNDVLVRSGDEESPAQWIAPAWIVAAQVLRSIAATGWPSEITGRSGAISGFDVHEVTVGGRRTACATAALFTTGACRSLADAGILAVNGTPDRDEASTVAAPTVHRPGRFPDDPHGRAARLLSSLPYQLAAARLAGLAAAARSSFAGGAPDGLAAYVESWLGGALALTGPGAALAVRVEPDPDEPGRQVLVIDARTGSAVLGGESFGFDIPL